MSSYIKPAALFFTLWGTVEHCASHFEPTPVIKDDLRRSSNFKLITGIAAGALAYLISPSGSGLYSKSSLIAICSLTPSALVGILLHLIGMLNTDTDTVAENDLLRIKFGFTNLLSKITYTFALSCLHPLALRADGFHPYRFAIFIPNRSLNIFTIKNGLILLSVYGIFQAFLATVAASPARAKQLQISSATKFALVSGLFALDQTLV